MSEPSDWRALDAAELERQYNARATVPDITPFIERYRALSEQMLASLPCERNLAYGPGEAERLDLFPVHGGSDAPLFVYIHGGYWRILSKEEGSFMAGNFTAQGIAVASLDYALAPKARLEDIVAQCRRALVWLHRRGYRRIVVGGSSAGGHLAAMVIAQDWQLGAGLPEGVIAGGIPVSGLFDLEPVQATLPNEWLALDVARARALSPLHRLPPIGTRLCVAAAALDTDEFRRQSRQYAAACASHGCPTTGIEIAGRNHFDVVLDWTDPDSELSRAAFALF